MYKNQLQELAQRSCFNLPSYSCVREGPDHAPRFKATVNFNGETFESPAFCSTLRQAEHAAAEVALNTLACRGPSRALATRVLDETGVYKNLLQETAHRAGLKLPNYTTVRSGPGHVPIFSCTVVLAGMSFTGEAARTKKQAQKNAAMTAWSSLKRLVQHGLTSSSSPSSSSSENVKGGDDQEQVVIARFLSSIQPAETKNFRPSVSQGGQDRFIPICRGLTPPTASLYPLQYQNWGYPRFSPEMAIYQIWQQEQLLQLQNQLLTLQLPPSPPPPYIQSILPPTSHLFVPMREQEPVPVNPRITIASSGPLLCFSDNNSSDAVRGKSTVTIREIHEEKTEEFPECSSSVAPDHSKLEGIKLGESQTDTSCGNIDIGHTDVSFQGRNPHGYVSRSSSTSQPPVMIRNTDTRTRPSASAAASPVRVRHVGPDMAARCPVPPRLRTGNPLNSTRPAQNKMDFGGVYPRYMAPAVRIRSVVPVCSAPPPRKMPTTEPGASVANDRKETFSGENSTKISEH